MLRPTLIVCCASFFLLSGLAIGKETPTGEALSAKTSIPLPPNQEAAAAFANALAASLPLTSSHQRALPVELVVMSASGGQNGNACCPPKTASCPPQRKRRCRRGCR